jgi:hypothetical protein
MEVKMDELVLDVDVEEATGSELLVKSEPEADLNAVKSSTDLVTVTGPIGKNGEGESSPSEPKWLQQDEPIALWVKVIIIRVFYLQIRNL